MKTAAISFAELEKLHAVSDLCERLRDSGRFSRTLSLILPHYFTPFAFYKAFDEHLEKTVGKELQKISQRDLFLHLSQFLKKKLPPDAQEAISTALTADFSAAEVRRPPKAL